MRVVYFGVVIFVVLVGSVVKDRVVMIGKDRISDQEIIC